MGNGGAINAAATRILVADDEEQILNEYTQVLGRLSAASATDQVLRELEAELFGEPDSTGDLPFESYDLTLCRQGDEAIAAVVRGIDEGRPFSVAFLDVRMPPGIDGVRAAERIRTIDPDINIVFVTGFSDIRPQQITERIQPADKVLYCQKPLQAGELRQFAQALSAKWLGERCLARRLHETSNRLHQLLTATPVIIYSCEPTKPYATTYVSDNVRQQFGYDPAVFLDGRRSWPDTVHSEDLPRIRSAIREVFASGQASVEYRFRHADGRYRWVHDRLTLVHSLDGRPSELVGCWIDVTERRDAEERIRHLAYFDALTGLPNRTFMKELLEHQLASAVRYGRVVAVLFLGIDHFKRINDTLGHAAGDTLLREVGSRLLECVRASDSVFRPDLDAGGGESAVSRPGGDEFIVILTELRTAEDVAIAAQRVATALTRPVQLGSDEVSVTASIGISVFPDDGSDAESLLKHADTAMEFAKKQGRGRFQFFTQELNERTARRLSLETRLRKAVARNEFLLHYQPKIDLHSLAVVGVEALIRWQPPDGELVHPGEFIPIAEEIGMIVPIGEWVVREACRQAVAWIAEGLPPVTMSVNLSAPQFKDQSLVERIKRGLEESGLDGRHLEVELTESLLIEDVRASCATLNELKALGLNISIDDFGTGYSSLSYLKTFPLNALKIDRSFVRDITTDPSDAAIVSATIALAHNLRLKVIAEGVEDQVQVEILRAQGCDEAQGYFFSRPLPAEALVEWRRRWRPIAA